jgi:hypothetical protein
MPCHGGRRSASKPHTTNSLALQMSRFAARPHFLRWDSYSGQLRDGSVMAATAESHASIPLEAIKTLPAALQEAGSPHL